MARKKTVVESEVAEDKVAEVEEVEVEEQDESETKQSAAQTAALQSRVWTNITGVVEMFLASQEHNAHLSDGETDIAWGAEIPKDNRLPIRLRASKPWVRDDDQTLVECVVTVDARQANPCRIEWFVPHLRLKTLSVVETMAVATQIMAMVTKFLTTAAEKAEVEHAEGDATEDE